MKPGERYEVIKALTVSANRRQVYDFLLVVCNEDTRFCIQTPKTDNDWGALTVASMRAARLLDGHIRGAVFGTVRLIDLGERTAVRFVDKDTMYRVLPNDYGKRLFLEFAELAEACFIRHGILDSGAPEQPAETGGGSEAIPQRRPPGRKGEPKYDRAYQRIAGGLSGKETWELFCQEEGTDPDDCMLEDAFEAAMRRRKEKAATK